MSLKLVRPQTFRPITESRFRKPCGTVEKSSLNVLLKDFTLASFPANNPISSVFEVLVQKFGYRFYSSIVQPTALYVTVNPISTFQTNSTIASFFGGGFQTYLINY